MRDSKQRIVVAGGGTGGHLFPGVAVVEALEELAPDRFEFSFVGAERGIEARKIPQLGYPIRLLDVKPLKNGGASGLAKGLASLPRAGIQAIRFLGELKPDLVLAVGGYAAGPFTALASVRGVKTALLEQNAIPGLTNQWLGKLVDRAYLSFDASKDYFSRPLCKTVGNPIRRAFRDLGRDFEYARPGAESFHILVIGGSGGARSLNLGVPEALKRLPTDVQSRLNVVHQCGRGRHESAAKGYAGFEGEVEVVEFIDDMAEAYRNTNLMICRAGMSTIAEVTVLGIPAVYVPLGIGDGHQVANALQITEAGGGMMIPDDEVASERMTRLIEGLVRNPASLANVAAQARTLGQPEAAEVVARDLMEWLK